MSDKKTECNIIKDLLPLYVDGVVSEESKKLVDEHLQDCETCKQEYEKAKENIVMQVNNDMKPLKRIKKKIIWKQVFAGAISTILVLTILFVGAYFVTDFGIPVDYEDIRDKIVIEEKEDGNVKISVPMDISGNHARYVVVNKDLNKGIVEIAYYIYTEQTIWEKYFSNENIGYLYNSEGTHSYGTENGIEYEDVVVAVYYQHFNYDKKADLDKRFVPTEDPVLIWEKEK